MSVRLKKIEDQFMVITGAKSGIDLTTARLAASRGAKLVLVVRDVLPQAQSKGEAPRNPAGSSHAPGGPTLEERGEYHGHAMESSADTAAAIHPKSVALLALSTEVTVDALVGTMTYLGQPRSRSWFA